MSGPGYTTAIPNEDYQNVNSGSLIYDCTMANTQTWGTLKWFCGYGGHVKLGDVYFIVDMPSSTKELVYLKIKLKKKTRKIPLKSYLSIKKLIQGCEIRFT